MQFTAGSSNVERKADGAWALFSSFSWHCSRKFCYIREKLYRSGTKMFLDWWWRLFLSGPPHIITSFLQSTMIITESVNSGCLSVSLKIPRTFPHLDLLQTKDNDSSYRTKKRFSVYSENKK
jgi:hypothetical protein